MNQGAKSKGIRNGCLIASAIIVLLLGAVEVKTGIGRFIFIIATTSIKEHLHRIPFNSTDWKNPKLVDANIRIRMVDDLLSRHRLIGMNKSEVFRLLGKPGTSYTPGEIEYYLGPERGWISIDAEVLRIRFDRTGTVVSAETIST